MTAKMCQGLEKIIRTCHAELVKKRTRLFSLLLSIFIPLVILLSTPKILNLQVEAVVVACIKESGYCDSMHKCCDKLTCKDLKCAKIEDLHTPGNDDRLEGQSCTTDAKGGSPDPKRNCGENLICDTGGKCAAGATKCEGTCKRKEKEEKKETKKPEPPPPPPCEKFGAKGKCDSVPTALGSISTQPEGFVQKIFAVLLGLSGGVALLLIIKAGYQIMTSQGKPEGLQQGRDQLIAAIVGLLFLIFSFVLLQVIGVDILRLPGFK